LLVAHRRHETHYEVVEMVVADPRLLGHQEPSRSFDDIVEVCSLEFMYVYGL
jgi:hypothetical protein